MRQQVQIARHSGFMHLRRTAHIGFPLFFAAKLSARTALPGCEDRIICHVSPAPVAKDRFRLHRLNLKTITLMIEIDRAIMRFV